MKRLGAVGAAGAVVIGVFMAVSTAVADTPGNSQNAKLCQKDGWMTLYTRSGQPFSSEEACTSYAAMGGQLIVKAALACLNNGWKTLGPTSAQPFASEQACVDFVNAGGTPVAAGADLALAKSVNNATPNVGDTVTFTVTLSDLGPVTATNVQVTDLLPTGLTFISATPSQGFYINGSGLWTVGTVTTSAPQTLHIHALVVSPTAQTNTAAIAHSDQFDPTTTNNSASATETPQQADLALAKTVSNATPNVGDTVSFTITLTDLGPAAATNVQVTDLLPTGLTFVSVTPSKGTYISGVWTVGTVTMSTPQTMQIQAQVDSASTLTNTATISHSDQFDPTTANNSASATVTPQQADLAITKSDGQSTAAAGGSTTYTIVVSNSGGVVFAAPVVDHLPAAISSASWSAAASPGSSVASVNGSGDIDTTVTLLPGGTVTFTLVAQISVSATGTLSNTATVSMPAGLTDPTPDDNTATDTDTLL
jgi:uncharacterized repeat protein (TIGR01451 family)